MDYLCEVVVSAINGFPAFPLVARSYVPPYCHLPSTLADDPW